MEPNKAGEYILEAAKAAPPVAISAFAVGGVGLADWVMIVTLLYTLLQAGYFIYDKFIRTRSGR